MKRSFQQTYLASCKILSIHNITRSVAKDLHSYPNKSVNFLECTYSIYSVTDRNIVYFPHFSWSHYILHKAKFSKISFLLLWIWIKFRVWFRLKPCIICWIIDYDYGVLNRSCSSWCVPSILLFCWQKFTATICNSKS